MELDGLNNFSSCSTWKEEGRNVSKKLYENNACYCIRESDLDSDGDWFFDSKYARSSEDES